MKRKWTERQYHIQNINAVAQQDVKIYCNTNKFSELPFCGPHSKPHVTKGLSKYYHFRSDPKICNGVCAILRITCDCVT